jgi:hypothetical protein
MTHVVGQADSPAQAVRAALAARRRRLPAPAEFLRYLLAPARCAVDLRTVLNNYAAVLRRNNHKREARSVEARSAKIQINHTSASIVDITDLLPKAKPSRK